MVKNGGKVRRVAAVAAVLALAGSAMAVPPTMPAITEVVDLDSVATQLTASGGQVMLICFGVIVAFALAWKLFGRLRRAI